MMLAMLLFPYVVSEDSPHALIGSPRALQKLGTRMSDIILYLARLIEEYFDAVQVGSDPLHETVRLRFIAS